MVIDFPPQMGIDFTSQLAPLLWGLLGTLLLSAAAILASVDPHPSADNSRRRRLAIATSAAAILLAVYLAAGPTIAASLGLATR